MAYQWRTSILVLPATLNGAIIPILSNLYSVNGQTSMHSYRKVVLFNLATTAVITGIIATAIAVASPLIVAAYGPEFRGAPGAKLILIMVCASAILLALNDVVGADLTGRGKVWLGAVFCFFVSCSLVIFSALLVPRYGARGLAATILISYTLHSIWQGTYLWRALKKPPPGALPAAAPNPEPNTVV